MLRRVFFYRKAFILKVVKLDTVDSVIFVDVIENSVTDLLSQKCCAVTQLFLYHAAIFFKFHEDLCSLIALAIKLFHEIHGTDVTRPAVKGEAPPLLSAKMARKWVAFLN